MRRVLLALPLAFALASACGSDELMQVKTHASTPDAGPNPPPTASDSGAPPPAPKRTVFTRNPFGDVQAKDNLLWDGDFEWFTAFADQYGWVNVGSLLVVSSSAFTNVRVSPDCRSGMKCGYLSQNQRTAAVGVSPGGDQNVSASVWIRVPNGDCAGDMGVTLISCDYSVDPDLDLADADGKPDAKGWCHYEGVSAPRQRATCLYVEARFPDGEALLDDAVVRAAPAGATPSGIVASPAEHAKLESVRKLLRERLRPRPPGTNKAREAFERRARRRP
jgi:hypothetical protein